jgi:hypothetical protein
MLIDDTNGECVENVTELVSRATVSAPDPLAPNKLVRFRRVLLFAFFNSTSFLRTTQYVPRKWNNSISQKRSVQLESTII